MRLLFRSKTLDMTEVANDPAKDRAQKHPDREENEWLRNASCK
jgi:hypothetical protein